MKYYKEYFTVNSSNIKIIWNGISQLVSLKPRTKNIPTKIISQEKEITNLAEITNEFNSFFANIGKNLASEIPKEPTATTFSSYLDNPTISSFVLTPADKQEIEDVIDSLNPLKANGPFSTPVNILKLLKPCISIPLSIIFNYSLSNGTVPDHFKLAKVIPIHKKGSTLLLSNYRPISLLSIFNKILEKLVYNKLIVYLDKLSIIYEKQFGSQKKKKKKKMFYNTCCDSSNK